MTTPFPLRILTTPELAATPELQADAAKGHTVVVMGLGDDPRDYDVIMAPNAWRIRPDQLQYRELAYKEARAGKRARKPKLTSGKEEGEK